MSSGTGSKHFRTEPVSFMDAHSGGAHLMLTIAVTFSGVVDQDLISDSARTLARTWPMLGCHVRMGAEGALELLFPDPEHATLSTTFSHIPKPLLAVTSLPQRTQSITTQRLNRNNSLFHATPLPANACAYIQQTPRPGFLLHVSILSDATIFSLTFPHVLMDASSVTTVMRALLGIMRGEEVEGYVAVDPFASILPTTASDPGRPEGWTTYGPAEFILAAAAEEADLERDGPVSQRTIYFPRHEIEKLKAEAMAELGGSVPYLSSGDIIVAWLYKHFYGDELYDPDRTSRLLYVLDSRLRLPSLFPPSSVYLRNAYLVCCETPLTNARVRDMSIAELARVVRLLVEKSSREENVKDAIRWKWYQSLEGGVQVPATAGERVLFASNWLTFGIGGLTVRNSIRPFSGTGQVIDVYCGMPSIPRCSGVITFRDSAGGVTAQFDWAEKNWTSGKMGEYAIERLEVEEILKADQGGAGKEGVEAVVENRLAMSEEWGVHALISWARELVKM